MCTTSTRHSTICDHIRTHTTPCLRVTLFKRAPCTEPTLEKTLHYEICHDCRHFWAFHDVPEWDARSKYVRYREQHKYYGPLTGVKYKSDKPPVLQRERFGEVDAEIERRVREAEEIEAMERECRVPLVEASRSTDTLWPCARSKERDEDEDEDDVIFDRDLECLSGVDDMHGEIGAVAGEQKVRTFGADRNEAFDDGNVVDHRSRQNSGSAERQYTAYNFPAGVRGLYQHSNGTDKRDV